MFLPRKPVHPLVSKAKIYRELMLKMTDAAGAGHIGGALSAIDFLTGLYHSPLFDFEKDHFILSPGHYCLALYSVLSDIHHLPEKELLTFSRFGSRYQGHTSLKVPGVEYASGSLGQGLSFACGLAVGDRSHHTVCLSTEAEHNEGQFWEAIMFANKYHLGNLISVVDYNGIQIDGKTSEIMPLGELASKYLRFGWTVSTIDGHDFYAIEKALKKAKDSSIYPACIILRTRFGKGVSFMENNHKYHHIKDLPEDLYLKALAEVGGTNEN